MNHLQQLRKGSTPLLILSVLTDRKKYGYEIMQEIEAKSDGFFTMTAALLYPALHKLEKEALVESEWMDGVGKRQRKYYTITESGLKALGDSKNDWKNFISNLFSMIGEDLHDGSGVTYEPI